MSLILDALNKADREREYRNAVPDLNTIHASARPATDRRLLWLAAGLAVALLLLVLVLLVLWLRSATPSADVRTRTPDPAEVVESPQVAAVPSSPSSEPRAAAQMPSSSVDVAALVTDEMLRATVDGLADGSVDQEVQALYQTHADTKVLEVVEPQVQTEVPPQAPAAAELQRQSTVDEALVRTLWEESKREMDKPVPLPAAAVPQPKVAAQPPKPPINASVEDTLAGHTSVPFLHELPVSVQNTIPTLMYAKHEYEKGFVVINKEELQVGSATEGGVLLERILADGVLMSLNGTTFKLSSLSSWVNY